MTHDPLHSLYTLTSARSARCSTWDRTGGNKDWVTIAPGDTHVVADIAGPGCIRHFYATTIGAGRLEWRWAVLRMHWDGEETPSVEVPLGDFFGIAHCSPRPLQSLAMVANPSNDRLNDFGLNCYFPMPFALGARITVENQGPARIGGVFGAFWFHVDYERWAEPPPPDAGRFHAQWRRENPTRVSPDITARNTPHPPNTNTTGADNYVMLEAEGHGHLAGIHLQVDNLGGGWYGEGDDMIFVDDDTWPPSIHGTGTEEVFAGGACPSLPYCSPYAGFHLVDNRDFSRFTAMYRWYLADPVRFQHRIRATIEHGHANNYENDYTSVAYWYQTEPHAQFPTLPPVEQRLPRFPEDFARTLDEAPAVARALHGRRAELGEGRFAQLDALRGELDLALRDNRFVAAPGMLEELQQVLEGGTAV
jgi:hypothetical protein